MLLAPLPAPICTQNFYLNFCICFIWSSNLFWRSKCTAPTSRMHFGQIQKYRASGNFQFGSFEFVSLCADLSDNMREKELKDKVTDVFMLLLLVTRTHSQRNTHTHTHTQVRPQVTHSWRIWLQKLKQTKNAERHDNDLF